MGFLKASHFLSLGLLITELAAAQTVTMPIANLDPNDYDGTARGPYETVWQGNYNKGSEGSGAHTGVDIAVTGNVLAIADGTVTRIRRTGTQTCGIPSWGVFVVIEHPIAGVGRIFSVYSHLQNESVPADVLVGQPVVTGQMIGRVGNTGNACPQGAGIHLHFQIDRNLIGTHPYWCGDENDPNNGPCVAEQTINPIPFIRSRHVAPTFNAARDFSITLNGPPDSVWSYGATGSLTDPNAFVRYPVALAQPNASNTGLDVWNFGGNFTSPTVIGNRTGTTINFSSVEYTPGIVNVHPTVSRPPYTFSVVRWTAPSAGNYSINGFFQGIDIAGTTTDVFVLRNGAQLFNGAITGFGIGTRQSFSFGPLLAADDKIDFAVGPRFDETHDSTGLSVEITKQP